MLCRCEPGSGYRNHSHRQQNVDAFAINFPHLRAVIPVLDQKGVNGRQKVEGGESTEAGRRKMNARDAAGLDFSYGGSR